MAKAIRSCSLRDACIGQGSASWVGPLSRFPVCNGPGTNTDSRNKLGITPSTIFTWLDKVLDNQFHPMFSENRAIN